MHARTPAVNHIEWASKAHHSQSRRTRSFWREYDAALHSCVGPGVLALWAAGAESAAAGLVAAMCCINCSASGLLQFVSCTLPHRTPPRAACLAVNTDFRPVDGPWSKPVAYGRAAIHHYATRSVEDLQAKWRRGLPGGMPGRNYTFLQQIEELCTSTCVEAVPLGRRLQEKYGSLLRGPASQRMA